MQKHFQTFLLLLVIFESCANPPEFSLIEFNSTLTFLPNSCNALVQESFIVSLPQFQPSLTLIRNTTGFRGLYFISFQSPDCQISSYGYNYYGPNRQNVYFFEWNFFPFDLQNQTQFTFELSYNVTGLLGSTVHNDVNTFSWNIVPESWNGVPLQAVNAVVQLPWKLEPNISAENLQSPEIDGNFSNQTTIRFSFLPTSNTTFHVQFPEEQECLWLSYNSWDINSPLGVAVLAVTLALGMLAFCASIAVFLKFLLQEKRRSPKLY